MGNSRIGKKFSKTKNIRLNKKSMNKLIYIFQEIKIYAFYFIHMVYGIFCLLTTVYSSFSKLT
jgi:hypothetical protein